MSMTFGLMITFLRLSFVQTDMGNAAAAHFGASEPPLTLKESVDGLINVVCSAIAPSFFFLPFFCSTHFLQIRVKTKLVFY